MLGGQTVCTCLAEAQRETMRRVRCSSTVACFFVFFFVLWQPQQEREKEGWGGGLETKGKQANVTEILGKSCLCFCSQEHCWDDSETPVKSCTMALDRSSSAYTSDTHRKVMLQWPFTTHMAPNLQMVCQWVREGSGWKQLLPVSGWENKREMDRQETLGGQINRCPWSSELRGGMMSASLSTTVYHTMSAQWLALMSTVSSAL